MNESKMRTKSIRKKAVIKDQKVAESWFYYRHR